MKKILNAYAGLGGNRSRWTGVDVIAVEINPILAKIYKKRFPQDQVIIGDVFEYLQDKTNNLNQFDLMWFSPPCPTHSQMQKFPRSKTRRIPIPDMTAIYGLLIWFKRNYSGCYVIENVQPWYHVLITPTVILNRHLFWSNFPIKKKKFENEVKIKHGSLSQAGSTMRKSYEDFLIQNELLDIREELDKLDWKKDPRKDVIARNCVRPDVGKYILDQLINKPTLLNYF